MSGWNKPKDTVAVIQDLERRTAALGTVANYDDDDPPAAPSSAPTIVFSVKEFKTHAEYKAVVSFNLVTPNTCQADIELYHVQLQPTNAAGVPKTEGITRNDYVEPNDEVVKGIFLDITNPPKDGVPTAGWYWRARYRVRDKGHRWSGFSTWTTPQLPTVVANPLPPTPTGLAVIYDRLEATRYTRSRARVACDPVGSWDIPGYDKEPDVAYYIFMMRRANSDGTPYLDANGFQVRRTSIVDAKQHEDDSGGTRVSATFRGLYSKNYYQFRVRTRDRFGRVGAWSSWTTAATPSDTTAPPVPTNVKLVSVIEGVLLDWTDPTDPADTELTHPDVAYYQVQFSKFSGFGVTLLFDKYVAATQRRKQTKMYNTNYWGRVRSVDASGNKSAWVSAGPKKPFRANAAATSPVDVKWENQSGASMAGGTGNRAGFTDVEQHATAHVNVGVRDLSVEALIRLGPTYGVAGLVMRMVSPASFLVAKLTKTASVDTITLDKIVLSGTGATITTLASVNPASLVNGKTYFMEVLAIENDIKVYLDGVEKLSYTLTGGDATTYGTGMAINNGKVGLYCLGSGTNDDGSRFDEWYARSLADEDSVYDYDTFTRARNNATLGSTEGGSLAWQQNQQDPLMTTPFYKAGTWGVLWGPQGTHHGFATTQPIFHADDLTNHTGVTIPAIGATPLRYTGVQIRVDRPVRCVIWGIADISNEDATSSLPLYLLLPVRTEQTNGTLIAETNGRMMGQYFANDSRRYQLTNMREFVLDTMPYSEVDIVFKWGYRNNGASGGITANVIKQKMIVWVTYAPDQAYNSDVAVTDWSTAKKTFDAYVVHEGSD